MEIKFTPFILFLILLVTLVISMLFGNSWLLSRKNTEGFVSFGYNNKNVMPVYIPQYSADVNKKVIYLYDNMYFDGANGNLIEVDSKFCGNVRVSGATVGNIDCNDSNGNSINNIYITTRSQAFSQYSTQLSSSGTVQPNNVNETRLAITPLNTHFTYVTKSSLSNYKYQIFYASWENDTYMHIMRLNQTETSGTNIQSYYNKNNGAIQFVPFSNSSTGVPFYKQSYLSNDDTNNGKLYEDPVYKKQIYQISKYVKYDIKNGRILVLKNTDNTSNYSYNIYNRQSGQLITDTNNTPVENISNMVSWIIPDNNNGMIIVMAQELNTLIMIINADPTQNQYILSYCVRFTDKQQYVGTTPSVNPVSNHVSNPVDKNVSPCHDELSCKWYYYFKTIGNDPSVLFKNDFIRKTQIVPPVCPKCPNCPGSGVCTSCGGKGGSGTSSTDSSGNIIGNTAKGAVNLTKEVVGGTVNLTKEVVGGTVNLAKDTVGGAVGLAKDTVGGAVNLVKDIGASTTKSGSTTQTGTLASSGVDQYSYYGALQSKGGNFMPVTADFSSFRR